MGGAHRTKAQKRRKKKKRLLRRAIYSALLDFLIEDFHLFHLLSISISYFILNYLPLHKVQANNFP